MIRFPEFELHFDLSSRFARGTFDGQPCVAREDGAAGWVFQRIPAAQDNGTLGELCEQARKACPAGKYGGLFDHKKDTPRLIGYARNPHTRDLVLFSSLNGSLTGVEQLNTCYSILGSLEFISPSMAQWQEFLAGRFLQSIDTYRRQLGSGDGYSSEVRYRFAADGSFEFISSSHISISGLPSTSASQTTQTRRVGEWAMVEIGGETRLRLDDSDDKRTLHRLSREASRVLLDGQPHSVGRL